MHSTAKQFSVINARQQFFASKEEYLSFRCAWSKLTQSRTPLAPSIFAAHAILTGRDLYKAFSPSRRTHEKDVPYRALVLALQYLPYQNNASMPAEQLSAEEILALLSAITKASSFIAASRPSSAAFAHMVNAGEAKFAEPVTASA